jgi:hypothetical protein
MQVLRHRCVPVTAKELIEEMDNEPNKVLEDCYDEARAI